MAGLPKSGVILVAEDAPSFFATLDRANRAVTGFADQGDQAGGRFSHGFGQIVTGALREVGAQLVNFAAEGGKALAGFIKDSIGVAADFEQTMNVLQATSGATGDEIAQISKKAKELGADLTLPATSAVDAGEAMLELSKAGFTVQQSMDAAKGVLQLSAAAQIDEAEAAEINANALNAFHLSATDSIFVSDLLAASASASSIDIKDAAKSYQMAGAIFANFQGPVVGSKQAIIDLTTAVGLLGNAGIKGSDAGTSLKQALLQLTGPSDKAKALMRELARSIGESGDIAYTAQGQMRSFPEILGLVSRATAGLTEEKRNQYITDIFGADASRAILILMQQGPDAWDKMSAAVTRQGAAADLAAAQTKGFKGALEGAKSQLETLQLTLGEKFLPILADLTNTYLSPAIAQLTTLAQALFGDKDAIDQLSPPLQEVMRWVNSATSAFRLWEKGTISTRTALNVVAEGLGQFAPIVDTVIRGVQGIVNAFGEGGLGAAIPKTLEVLGNLRLQIVTWILGMLPSIIDTLGGWVTAFGDWVVRAGPPMLEKLGIQTGLLLDTIGAALPGIVEKLATWGAAFVQWIIDKGPDLLRELAALGLKVVNWIVERLPGITQQLGKWAIEFISWVLPTTGKLIIELGKLLGEFLVWFVNSYPQIKAKLEEWGIQFGVWIRTSAIPALIKGLADLAKMLWDWIAQKAKDIAANDSIGSAIVNAISNGISKAWNGLVNWFKGKLKELTDMLPFSEPEDPHSPLYGLSNVGKAIVRNIQQGINESAPLTPPLLGTGETSGATYLQGLAGNAPQYVSPPAQSSQMPCNCANPITNSKTINMPIYTNNSPAALQQSWAIMNASMP